MFSPKSMSNLGRLTVYLLHSYLQLRLYSKRNMVYGTLYVPELTIPHISVRRLQNTYIITWATLCKSRQPYF